MYFTPLDDLPNNNSYTLQTRICSQNISKERLVIGMSASWKRSARLPTRPSKRAQCYAEQREALIKL